MKGNRNMEKGKSITIPEKEIKEITTQANPLAKKVDSIEIKEEKDIAQASVIQRQIKDMLNSIEQKRLEFTGPLNQSLKAINGTFKEIKRPLQDAMSSVNIKILTWRGEEQKRIAKEEERRRKIQDAHEKQGHQVNEPVVMKRPEKSILHSQVRKVWKFKVNDFKKVHDVYKVIDEGRVKAALRANLSVEKKPPEIDGIEFYQEEVLAVI